MSLIRAPWRYYVEDSRADYLLNAPAFPDIVDGLCRDFIPLDCRIESANAPHLQKRGCKRISLILVAGGDVNVAKKSLDVFFNSTTGYRANYYLSSSKGDDASKLLFASLVQIPLAQLVAHGLGDWPPERVYRSLTFATAKIWPLKADYPNPGMCEIDAPHWVKALELPGWEPQLGVRAPQLERIEIKGAWLDGDHNAFVDPDKADRSRRLHDFGWV
jgi:hypothetical protein